MTNQVTGTLGPPLAVSEQAPNLWMTLRALLAAEPRMVALSEIRTHPALQPRNDRLVPYKDKFRIEERSREQRHALGLALGSHHDAHLEPVLLAEISDHGSDGPNAGLYVVDGHHRLAAYREMNRLEIPGRVYPMGFSLAVLASKPINCSGRALEMHREQKLDAAWQYISMVTDRGKLQGLPGGESTRTVSRRFGIGHNTVARMLASLREIKPEGYSQAMFDEGTQWPRWRYVRQPKSTFPEPSAEDRTRREAERLAKKIVEMMCNSTNEARAMALGLLAYEEAEVPDRDEAVAFLSDMARPYGTDPALALSQWDKGVAQLIQAVS